MLAILLFVAPEVVLIGFAGLLLAVFLDGSSGFLSRWTGLPRFAALPLFILLIAGGFTLALSGARLAVRVVVCAGGVTDGFTGAAAGTTGVAAALGCDAA